MFSVHKHVVPIAFASLVGFGLVSPSYGQKVAAQNKAVECQAIADVFEGGSTSFQNTGNLNASVALVDRLLAGMQKLQLQDPQLRSLQGRYIQYFSSASQMMQAAGKANTAGNTATLENMMTLAQANNAVGSQLSQELVSRWTKLITHININRTKANRKLRQCS